ncbi:amidase [Wenxinia saemankumensis]|uniref:Aspartyl-tRNA(Asn)/glutamyl-tRNA(Gln) amidotransferase subunit A n=1 Tax=Wenxinia saemankumensis TaxID=1447782 RepID=A0A1M6HXR5_9RHOB|nr:amidase [Wenxinia saemankumensis]SHJ27010.1 aspartyl-tRNA(Asn)/glutamyl-tRNA(Gln) amidotransferase subunit A [Wenxinia saemankumensis]
MREPTELTIAEAGAALRGGTLTAEALTRAHLDLIGRRNEALNAFTEVTADRALAAARQADADLSAGRDRGPMQGIPFAIKDLIDLDGATVACGSRGRAGRKATSTAPAVQRLLDAGAVPLGMVATYEYALVGPSSDGPYPAARNPWSAEHITGGSSSGSASAVAGGLVRVALGTDTGGSVRSPAAYCGIVGLKPTKGTVPTEGVFPLSPTLDHVGPLARSVPDAAAIFAALTGAATPRLDRGLGGLRIAYARGWAMSEEAAPGLLELTDDSVAVLSMEGARTRIADLPDIALAEAAGAILIHAEALESHPELAGRGDGYGRMAFQSLIAGAALTGEDVARAHRVAVRLRAGLDAVLEAHDAIVTPTTLTPAPPLSAFAGGRAAWTPMRTLPFNVSGHPALTVPMGFIGGLPVGLQIVGRHGDEATILRIGAAFEAATDHGALRPPCPAGAATPHRGASRPDAGGRMQDGETGSQPGR